ncbi:hypothetical protein EX30DRAFT_395644 [Ascodesmis nigricans]|uniref:Chromo domain-containing protein n=1 Tax=Ascodesmis nigricans TaxID=341454 RepID=A0A4S2MXV0_9PEZI|nr:hypothetical protein EX30DRAFT_395644 [Ascodesmis nigricans]
MAQLCSLAAIDNINPCELIIENFLLIITVSLVICAFLFAAEACLRDWAEKREIKEAARKERELQKKIYDEWKAEGMSQMKLRNGIRSSGITACLNGDHSACGTGSEHRYEDDDTSSFYESHYSRESTVSDDSADRQLKLEYGKVSGFESDGSMTATEDDNFLSMSESERSGTPTPRARKFVPSAIQKIKQESAWPAQKGYKALPTPPPTVKPLFDASSTIRVEPATPTKQKPQQSLYTSLNPYVREMSNTPLFTSPNANPVQLFPPNHRNEEKPFLMGSTSPSLMQATPSSKKPTIDPGDLVLRRRPMYTIIRNTSDEKDLYDGPFIVQSVLIPIPAAPPSTSLPIKDPTQGLISPTPPRTPAVYAKLKISPTSQMPNIVALRDLRPYVGNITKEDIEEGMRGMGVHGDLFSVNRIRGMKLVGNVRMVRVNWLGWGSEDDTWEVMDFAPADEIEAYRARQRRWLVETGNYLLYQQATD